MKSLLIASVLFSALSAQALEIACWDTYSKKGSRPYFSAEVVEGNALTKVRLNKRAGQEWNWDQDLKLPNTQNLEAQRITSNRSPYKGNSEYLLDGGRIILPADLAPAALKAQIAKGIGMGAGENGVIIGNFSGGDGAGSHFSIRLRCSSK